MNNLSHRAADPSDAASISALVADALIPATLPGWTAQSVASLLAKASASGLRDNIREAAFAHVVVEAGTIVGFILAKQVRFINLVVVAPSVQRLGIGSQLVKLMLSGVADTAPDVSVVEVNATEHSFPFYRRLGFYPLSEFIEYDGCRFARLGYWRRNPLLLSRDG